MPGHPPVSINSQRIRVRGNTSIRGSASALSMQDWLAGGIQLTEHEDKLYLATDTEVLASEDTGETWHSLGAHPKGAPRGFAVTDTGFYIAFIQDIFFSEDGKTSWVSLKDDLAFEKRSGHLSLLEIVCLLARILDSIAAILRLGNSCPWGRQINRSKN